MGGTQAVRRRQAYAWKRSTQDGMAGKGRVLIVDDALAVRQQIRTVLERVSRRDFEFFEAANLTAALKEFRQAEPDIIFLDMRLPKEEDGLNAIRVMLQERPEAMIVLFTGLDKGHPAVQEAISMGAAAYIQKPPSMSDFERVLEELDRRSGRLSRVR